MTATTWTQRDSSILKVTDLQTQFKTQDGRVFAVNGVSFNVDAGEMLGVVGESGSGKSVTMMSLLRLIPMPPGEIVAGEALFGGQDLLHVSEDEIREIRGGQIGFIFQDPMTSLNPVLTIGRQITEALRVHLGLNKAQARARAVELLDLVGIPRGADRLRDFPHQFSGGMRQRVMIAIALACDPQLLIADEPTTALDVTIQAQIIDLVKRLQDKLGMSVIWITHDLGVVAGIADRILVMYAGLIVEHAAAGELFKHPLHPYTQGLLGSLPRLDTTRNDRLTNILGQPPDLRNQPTSCAFAPRCPYAFERCHAENPALIRAREGHDVACWWDVESGGARYGS